MKSSHIKQNIMGLTLSGLVMLGVASPAHALRIIPHLTSGPAIISDIASPISGPMPLLPGSSTALDCKAVNTLLGGNLQTTETGALCLAISNIEAHIKDNVTVEVEFYKIDFPAFGLPGVLGGAFPIVQWYGSPENNPSLKPQHGYNKMLSLLKAKSAKEDGKDSIISELPNLNQLSAIYPSNSFFNDFKPVSIAATRAQLKALKIQPAKSFTLLSTAPDSLSSLPNMDAVFVLGNDNTDPTITWDLNPSDGIGLLGPFTQTEYNSFRFNDLNTLPAGFFPNFPNVRPSIIDYQQVVQHELLHVLGVISNIDNGNPSDLVNPDFPNLPRQFQFVMIMDLFRFPENQVQNIQKPSDFKFASREWISEGQGNVCSVQSGNAVFVAGVTKNGPEVIPLSSGITGDGRQSSHLRSPYSIVRANPNCTGLTIGHNFHQQPPGPQMRPAHGTQVTAGKTNSFTNEDLRLLDLIGWDVDYSGKQTQSITSGASLSAANEGLTPAESIANSAEIYQSEMTILDPLDE